MTVSTQKARLPQLDGGLFLTDGGIETDLIFNDGFELPYFAAFHLLQTEKGMAALRAYFARYAAIARKAGIGFILESPTWRASADWGDKLGYSKQALAEANAKSIALIEELRTELGSVRMPLVVSGCVGPRGDGYDPGTVMSAEEAQGYHAEQIGVFARSGADMVTAITMTNANEPVGLTRAAQAAAMPVAVAFTVETDGRLPTGQSLREAIMEVDGATKDGPAYYMINCAHPTHFDTTLANDEAWVKRIRGIRANASRRSHAELNEAPDLDAGDPVELGGQYRALRLRHPQINVLGGCCGTDQRHISAICGACVA
ncbi:MAG: homocysteine S-methyltransferase family protein [Hyphomicrobiaceae bacterium]|jgi:S-methylmethionine-dependent homocysteine/selenocysteine methylase